MTNVQSVLRRIKRPDRGVILTAVILVLIYALVFVLEQILPPTSMLFTVLKKGATYALVAVSMNLLNGFTGLFSLGQAGFMLIGAYTYGILTIPVAQRAAVYQYYDGGLIQFAMPVIPALILAGVVAAIFAFLIGLPVLRLKSDYLAIATLGFAEIIRSIFQWDKLGAITNGSNMLRLFPTFNDFNIKNAEGEVTLYLSTLVPFLIAGVCIALIVALIHSSYGRAFMAIRDDEVAAEAMGINLARHKQFAFCLSSFFAGVGGAMLAMYQNSVQAKSFTSAMTYEILLIVVIGGIGSVTGSCIGSFLFVACSEWWLRFLDQKQMIGEWEVPLLRNGFRLVVFSLIIMVAVLFFRQGIMALRNCRIFSVKSCGESRRKGRGNEHRRNRPELEKCNHAIRRRGGRGQLQHARNQGETVALIGPNGAGKTTAFNVITGVYAPTNGCVKLRGKIIAQGHPTGKMRKLYAGTHIGEYNHLVSNTPDKITEMGVARTFQNIRLFKNMSVLENVLVARHMRLKAGLFASMLHVNQQEERRIRQESLDLLDMLGLGDVAQEKASSCPTASSAT